MVWCFRWDAVCIERKMCGWKGSELQAKGKPPSGLDRPYNDTPAPLRYFSTTTIFSTTSDSSYIDEVKTFNVDISKLEYNYAWSYCY
jgi:hypothetical protein